MQDAGATDGDSDSNSLSPVVVVVIVLLVLAGGLVVAALVWRHHKASTRSRRASLVSPMRGDIEFYDDGTRMVSPVDAKTPLTARAAASARYASAWSAGAGAGAGASAVLAPPPARPRSPPLYHYPPGGLEPVSHYLGDDADNDDFGFGAAETAFATSLPPTMYGFEDGGELYGFADV